MWLDVWTGPVNKRRGRQLTFACFMTLVDACAFRVNEVWVRVFNGPDGINL